MYIYGKNVASEYLKENKKIKRAFLNSRFNDEAIINTLQVNKIETRFVEKNELDRKVDGMHQGIILEVEDFKYSDIEDFTNKEDSLILILDHLEDPHNFGAIIRTAEAAGINGIIIPKDRSVDVNSTVVKVSTGAIENMKIAMVTNIVRTMEDLKKKGFWFVGTDMNGTDYTKIDYKGKIAIIIGNEGDGMSRLVKENCDFIASIPMRGTTNSLNASVATGIILYEAIKPRL